MKLPKLTIQHILIIGLSLLLIILLIKSCNRPKPEDNTLRDLRIETEQLKNRIKSDEQLIKDIIAQPSLSPNSQDSLFSEWEKRTGLQGFRDSIEASLRKND